MRELSHEELKRIQIDVLDYVVALCKKNKLNYWLDYGTLIGAVRHKGYIPWDDDIDISMLRKDYDQLIEICRSENHGRYRFGCVELDPDYMYTYGKMFDTETVVQEMGENGIRSNVYVDVFVYDNAPADSAERDRAYDKLDRLALFRRLQFPVRPGPMSLKRLRSILIHGFFRCFPKQYFVKKIVKESYQYKSIDTNLVFDITDQYYTLRWCVEKSMFQNLIDVEFEGKKYKAPERYDEWLKLQYGDYMKIPSEEERAASGHDMKAYSLN